MIGQSENGYYFQSEGADENQPYSSLFPNNNIARRASNFLDAI